MRPFELRDLRGSSPTAQAATPNQPVPVAPFLVGGTPHSTATLTGPKTLLWLVST